VFENRKIYSNLVIFFLILRLSTLPHYYVPKDGTLQSYRDFIVNMIPNNDHPEAFGQHPNGDIASQIKETRLLFDTLLSLQPQVTGGSSKANKKSTEEEVMELSTKVLDSLPSKIDYEGTVKIFSEDNSPLKVVLLQEIERYNILLDEIRQSLVDLQKGIQGLVVMSSELEEIFKCILEARVPNSWQKVTHYSFTTFGFYYFSNCLIDFKDVSFNETFSCMDTRLDSTCRSTC
jgi:dynein heavy chain